jgi:hypothetical protein
VKPEVGMKLKIHYGPNFKRLFEQEGQIANLQFKQMVEAMERVDPEGKEAHRIAEKYREEPAND